jgi:carbon monoxide dehydrogenase subunit G
VIEDRQSIAIDAPLARVWDIAKEIHAWSRLMPGFERCEIIDAANSCWTMKVGAGALVRTLTVLVSVTRWAGPEEVDFTYELKGDPVQGNGKYRARSTGPDASEMTLEIRVEGAGPMAPLWEAMGRPLLPKLVRGFNEQFKAQVEHTTQLTDASLTATRWTRFVNWLRKNTIRRQHLVH